MNKLEKVYGKTFKTILWFIAPFKKLLIETECEVHIFINNQAISILKNDGYSAAYELFHEYIEALNRGAVWADQDFRSREHFYNPYTKKGLYGCKTSKQRFEQYYKYALIHWECGDKETAMFYLGAAVHLIQDSTIPQHGNVNLLNNHRSYELWVIKIHNDFMHYAVDNKGLYYENPYHYIDMNAKCAIETCRRYSLIKNHGDKYFRITNITLPLAQRTTAGCLMNFFKTVNQ